MQKTKLKQGTLEWEKARLTRVGSSEVFDIVRYYATDDELQNCGINSEHFKAEKPYTTAWALYHKILNDGIYQCAVLPPEFAEYGHAAEPYGIYKLQQGRVRRLKPGMVYANDRLIASLDISGISEEIDRKPFNYGTGLVPIGKKFVCEQKTMQPKVVKNGIPFKYIIQAQYQIEMTKADFYILQIMALNNDTVFERGKITAMSKNKRFKYLDENMTVSNIYFANNPHLSALIKVCIDRFFDDIENRHEPKAFIEYDSPRNIIESIHINTAYNKKLEIAYDLTKYAKLKAEADKAELLKKAELQKITEQAKEYNASCFKSEDGKYTAKFSVSGAFLLKERET